METINHGMPVLYSFRRCPYAIRARLAIKYAQISIEIREVLLNHQPDSLLQISPKGTVPVLLLPDNRVIDESLDIMLWALANHDPNNWALKGQDSARSYADQLIVQNDTSFKHALDRYKYSDRYADSAATDYRLQGEEFISVLDHRLTQTPYLVSEHLSIADIAIFPFIRQFAAVDNDWFEKTPYSSIKSWLNMLLDANLFKLIMQKYSPWTIEQRLIL